MTEEVYTPEDNPILIRCKAHTELEIETLTDFQGKLKKLTAANRDRLIGLIMEKGFIAPIFIWPSDAGNMILDGHQRITVLNYLKENGWEIPPIPVAFIEAETEEEAREILLAISSQYGDFDEDVLSEWLAGTEDDMYRFLKSDEPPVPEEYHPILDPEVEQTEVSEEEVEEAKGKLKNQMDKKGKKEYETICPHCGKEFIVSV